MRGHEFLPQIAQTAATQWDLAATRLGVGLIVLGLVKKLGLADPIGATVDMFFAAPAALSLGEAWAAALLFAFQIYYDFSAYSDMAVGIGLLFGYQLRQNFRTPYVAADPSEFWRRWHVTLSEWIRDYVYFPLGGNRRGAARAQLNLAIAMLASGLWHGASWTFVFWGAWHALLLVGLRGWHALRGERAAAWFTGSVWRTLATGGFFLLVTLGWVFFRAASLEDAWILLAAMLDPRGLASLLTVKRPLLLVGGLYALHMAEAWLRADDGVRAGALVRATPWPLRGSLAAAFVLGYMYVYGGSRDFIYFQF
jgi:alginate O-acetyltransferase complex protein AlgI